MAFSMSSRFCRQPEADENADVKNAMARLHHRLACLQLLVRIRFPVAVSPVNRQYGSSLDHAFADCLDERFVLPIDWLTPANNW